MIEVLKQKNVRVFAVIHSHDKELMISDSAIFVEKMRSPDNFKKSKRAKDVLFTLKKLGAIKENVVGKSLLEMNNDIYITEPICDEKINEIRTKETSMRPLSVNSTSCVGRKKMIKIPKKIIDTWEATAILM